MEAALGLLLMLLGVSQGFEMSCDGRKNGAECYGPLGGAALIQLVDDASQIYRFVLWKDNRYRLKWVRRLVINLSGSRYAFTSSNGTFRINDLSRDDGGTYTLSFADERMGKLSYQTLLLHVQEPVSSPRLSLGCLSQGERTASCVSEGGESPHYSWTLEGRALTDAELLCGSSSTANITLKQLVSGRLVCRVWNNVSSLSVSEQISTCGNNFHLMNTWRLAAAALLVVVGLTCCVYWSVKRRRSGTDGNLQLKPSNRRSSGDRGHVSMGATDSSFSCTKH